MTVSAVQCSLGEILSPISSFLEETNAEMLRSMMTGFPEIDECASYVASGGGKRIRASLIILTAGLYGSFPDHITRLAASVEMLHAATLLHDDIIDNAHTRRGRKTVSELWGNRSAVLLGDFMFSKALDIAIELDRKDLYMIIADAAKGMVKGEFLQSRHSGILNSTKDAYYNIITLKTGGFMGACSYLGSAYSHMPISECENLKLFGQELGTAFQIIDDILDYKSNEDSTGKDEGNDFLNGKVTLPVLHTLEMVTPAVRNEIISFFDEPDAAGWGKLKEAALSSGAVGLCIRQAEEYTDCALSRLAQLPDSPCRNILSDLSHFIVERVY